MNLETILSYQWGAMMPEFIILGMATFICLLDLCLPARVNRRVIGWLAILGVLLSLFSLMSLLSSETTSILYDTFRLDLFAKAFKLLLLIGTLLILLMAESYTPKEGMAETRSDFYYLFLTALLGAMIMSSSGDLITMFVGLELLTISSYVLVAIRKYHLPSNEAALKYVINGGIATAITLFGMSYLFGLTGTTNIKEIGEMVTSFTDAPLQYVIGIAFFMIFVGFSFKMAVAPFHMWAPDVYQGAPIPVTAFLSVISKLAGFIIVLRIILSIYVGTSGDSTATVVFSLFENHRVYIAVIAGVTMVVGNIIALQQKNLKRLFAYSSIAHAGYLLVSIATLGYFTIGTVWFYFVAYGFMTIGAFAIIQHMSRQAGSSDIAHFTGFYRKSPLLAVMLSLFLLSMAGIPGTAGFIAKLHILLGLFSFGSAHYVLAAILMGVTVLSYVYYFGIMRKLFNEPTSSQINLRLVKMPVSLKIVVVICVIGTIGLGIIPTVAFDFLYDIFGSFEDFLS